MAGEMTEESALEAAVALRLGLPPYGLMDAERELPLEAADVGPYCLVRNSTLAKWRRDVSKPVTLSQARADIGVQFHGLVPLAHRFLVRHGFINFGLAKGPLLTPRGCEAAGRRSVLVVGAGFAGISAARKLQESGFRVLVVEGRGRPGGRVYSKVLAHGQSRATVDMGGSVITGIDGNPLAVVARQLQLPLHDIDGDSTALYAAGGGQVGDGEDRATEARFNSILDDAAEYVNTLDPEAADEISLGSAAEELWELDLREDAVAARGRAGLARALRQALAGSGRPGPGPGSGSEGAAPGPPLHVDSESEEAGDGESEVARGLFDWHLANLEYANAARVGNLSLRHWDQDDMWEMPGKHSFLPGGNGQLVEALAEGLNILYRHEVTAVEIAQTGVSVTARSLAEAQRAAGEGGGGGRDVGGEGEEEEEEGEGEGEEALHRPGGEEVTFRADAVLVTVPLGVLKQGNIDFRPPLPERHLSAVRRMGFGVLNKCIMVFPYSFWDSTENSEDSFGSVRTEHKDGRGNMFLFYGYHFISGGATLIGLVAGSAAEEAEGQRPGEQAATMLAVVREVFEKGDVTVPSPLHVVCTRWRADPFARGSYSSISRGAAGLDYDILAENVGGRLFFAGEHTWRQHPATMHGAFLSGIREAANICQYLCGREDGLKTRGERFQSAARKSAVRVKVETPQDCEAKLAVAAALSRLLERPAVEFGCFTAVPLKDSTCLLRIDVPALPGGKTALFEDPELEVYLTVKADLVEALCMIEGEDADSERIELLMLETDLLVGRDMLVECGPALASHPVIGQLWT